MGPTEIFYSWGHILAGYRPFLSIEVTRECPLRCPGCYAYEPQHLGGPITLRELSDFRGDALVDGILAVVDAHRPMHVSLVGGDPLVRYREMDRVIPQLVERGIHVQFVTSAFRPLPANWAQLPRLNFTVSIDGLQPEHDARRAPATYDRILKNIVGHRVSVHCTITAQLLKRESYLQEFLEFWSPRPETKRVWFSIFTPQVGDTAPEILSYEQRLFVVNELLRLRPLYPKLDMSEAIIREYAQPPKSPKDCIFARSTTTISADLKTRVTPCQFGGTPDCTQCGCIATMGLAAVGHAKPLPGVSLGGVMRASSVIGGVVNRARLGYRKARTRLRSRASRA
ncbi:MAG TPA: radical SAM protein [Terriglobales bacterium]|nr:radical SAM protein [Terriglobales bacterium]